MSRFELEEIGISLKGHQFKIHNEIKKLHITRKHHRQKDNDPLLSVVNYLTPVASPAASQSTAITEHHELDIKLRGSPLPIPLSPTSIHSHHSKYAGIGGGGLSLSTTRDAHGNTIYSSHNGRMPFHHHLTLNEDSSTMTRSLQPPSERNLDDHDHDHDSHHTHAHTDIDSLPPQTSHHHVPPAMNMEHGRSAKGNNPNDSGVSNPDDVEHDQHDKIIRWFMSEQNVKPDEITRKFSECQVC